MRITQRAARTALHVLLIGLSARAGAQDRTPLDATLSLERAREMARRSSPELTAAREALAAAAARQRQAGAYANPAFAYNREQTSAGDRTNAQNIYTIEQGIDLGGQRGARVAVASAQRAAAEARLASAEARLDFDVARAYARAVSTARRAALAERTAVAFERARRTSRARLAGGDVSGYENRRLELEAARYAALRAEAGAASRGAWVALALLISGDPPSIPPTPPVLVDSLAPSRLAPSVPDSIVAVALAHRADVRALEAEAAAAHAEVRLATRERVPTPVLAAGLKTERVAGESSTYRGIAAGVSLPLPLWDRRTYAVEAARGEARRSEAEAAALRRQVRREVFEAYHGYLAAAEQLDTLRAALDRDASAALRSADVAFAEGEMTLVEWLDAVRAVQDVESAYLTLWAEYITSRAALERAAGARLP